MVVLSQKRPKWLVVSGGDRYKDRLPDSNKNDNIYTRQGTVQPARFGLFVVSVMGPSPQTFSRPPESNCWILLGAYGSPKKLSVQVDGNMHERCRRPSNGLIQY